MHTSKRNILTTIILLSTATFSLAEVQLPAIFSNHMVLQQDAKIPVWGTATADETVTVALADQKQTAKADDQGNWRIDFKAMKAGGPHVLSVNGKTKVERTDVLVGEVWLCSGQSNMAFSVKSSNN